MISKGFHNLPLPLLSRIFSLHLPVLYPNGIRLLHVVFYQCLFILVECLLTEVTPSLRLSSLQPQNVLSLPKTQRLISVAMLYIFFGRTDCFCSTVLKYLPYLYSITYGTPLHLVACIGLLSL